MARPSHCNVLELSGSNPRFWRFGVQSSGNVGLSTDRTGNVASDSRRNYAEKSWSALWSPKLNIALLPVDQVFLRVLQLPKCEFDEVQSMVEFQLDRISPLPLTQIVWSIEQVPHKGTTPSDTQTVLVIIASSATVEEHLVKLESSGVMADRMEPPFLHQVLSTDVKGDGIWLHPQNSAQGAFCLIAWWYAGALQTVNIVNLTVPERWGVELGEEIRKGMWAGELEGWMTAPPKWHLVGDQSIADAWLPVLAPLAERPVEHVKALDPLELATASARGAARETTRTNLIPAEHLSRYQQKFVDGLWLRGLGAAFALYIIAVGSYFGWLEYLRWQKNDVEAKVAALEPGVKKIAQMRTQIAILEEQIALRYAALDSLRAVAENLKEGLTLTSLSYRRGSLVLTGKGPSGKDAAVVEFRDALQDAKSNGKPMFGAVDVKNVNNTTPTEFTWGITATINDLSKP